MEQTLYNKNRFENLFVNKGALRECNRNRICVYCRREINIFRFLFNYVISNYDETKMQNLAEGTKSSGKLQIDLLLKIYQNDMNG